MKLYPEIPLYDCILLLFEPFLLRVRNFLLAPCLKNSSANIDMEEFKIPAMTISSPLNAIFDGGSFEKEIPLMLGESELPMKFENMGNINNRQRETSTAITIVDLYFLFPDSVFISLNAR